MTPQNRIDANLGTPISRLAICTTPFGRMAFPEKTRRNLFVQGDVQFGGKLVGIERAASKKAVSYLYRRHFPAAFVYLEDEILGIGVFVDIHFDEVHATFLQKFLGAVAIHAPTRAVHCDVFHT
jgi:hypothetical protein